MASLLTWYCLFLAHIIDNAAGSFVGQIIADSYESTAHSIRIHDYKLLGYDECQAFSGCDAYAKKSGNAVANLIHHQNSVAVDPAGTAEPEIISPTAIADPIIISEFPGYFPTSFIIDPPVCTPDTAIYTTASLLISLPTIIPISTVTFPITSDDPSHPVQITVKKVLIYDDGKDPWRSIRNLFTKKMAERKKRNIEMDTSITKKKKRVLVNDTTSMEKEKKRATWDTGMRTRNIVMKKKKMKIVTVMKKKKKNVNTKRGRHGKEKVTKKVTLIKRKSGPSLICLMKIFKLQLHCPCIAWLRS